MKDTAVAPSNELMGRMDQLTIGGVWDIKMVLEVKMAIRKQPVFLPSTGEGRPCCQVLQVLTEPGDRWGVENMILERARLMAWVNKSDGTKMVLAGLESSRSILYISGKGGSFGYRWCFSSMYTHHPRELLAEEVPSCCCMWGNAGLGFFLPHAIFRGAWGDHSNELESKDAEEGLKKHNRSSVNEDLFSWKGISAALRVKLKPKVQ